MKKIVLALTILCIWAGSTLAQEGKTIKINDYDHKDINTVFKRNKRDGFYLSWSNGYTPINDQHGVYSSVRAAWIMDHWFAFGLVGTGFINNIDNLDHTLMYGSNDENYSLAGGYGGLVLEPILLPKKPIHLSFPIILGVGAVGIADPYYVYDYTPNYFDMIYLVEPGVELEMNFTRWLRIGLYGTYRITSEISLDNVSKTALNNYSVGVTFKIGLF